jgi:hypothetical protein
LDLECEDGETVITDIILFTIGMTFLVIAFGIAFLGPKRENYRYIKPDAEIPSVNNPQSQSEDDSSIN